MEPADNGGWVRFDEVEVILQRAEEALSIAVDLDDKTLTDSEREWTIEQIRGAHRDITGALARRKEAKTETCPNCGGDGSLPLGLGRVDCGVCEGYGQVPIEIVSEEALEETNDE
jgi:hypothetical protein